MPRGRPRKYGPAHPGKRFLKANKSMQQLVKREVYKAQETKESVVTYSGLGMTSVSYGGSAVVYGLTAAISQGTADGNRIGDQIFVRGIKVQLAIQPGDNSNYFRLLAIQPKGLFSAAGTAAQWVQEIFSNTASSATQWCAPVDTDKYRVLMDKMMYMTFKPIDGSTAGTVAQARIIRQWIPVNRKVQYAYLGTSGAVQPQNDIYLVAISDSAAVAHPGAVAGYAKTFYKDA